MHWREARLAGWQRICGIDEVGRGPLHQCHRCAASQQVALPANACDPVQSETRRRGVMSWLMVKDGIFSSDFALKGAADDLADDPAGVHALRRNGAVVEKNALAGLRGWELELRVHA